MGVRFVTTIATQMIIMAAGWQVYHITGRVLDLGFIGLSQFLPFLCLVLVSGHVADQIDRRAIILGCILSYIACAALLFYFAAAKLTIIWPIFLVLGLFGVTRAFMVPAVQSFIAVIVPPQALRGAFAVNSSVNQLAVIAGPSIGGVLYALAEAQVGRSSGAGLVYATTGGVLACAALLTSLIGRRPPSAARAVLSWRVLLEGLHFVWHRKTVLGAMSLDLFAVLFGGASALLPAYTHDVLHAGPEVFGYLRAAPGIGAGAMALLLAFRPISRRVGPTMFAAVGAFGLATVTLGLTSNFRVALVALTVLGVADMISVFVRALLVQLETPDAIRGRVSAVNSVCIGASNELGEFESGTTAAWFGLVPAIVLGGAATLLVAFLWARAFFPLLWRLQTFEQLKEASTHET